jgi:integrase
LLGRHYLDKLTAQHVLAYMNHKIESGLSARTVEYHHATLRVALNAALRWDLVPRNVAELVEPPRVRRHRIEPLSPDDAGRLLAAFRAHRLEALFTVALAVGLRLGEALGLRWEDVNFTDGTVTITGQLQKIDGVWTLVELKSEQSRRVVSLPDVSVRALREHRTRQLAEQLAAERWDNALGLVFTTSVGTPVDDANGRRDLNKAVKRADLRTANGQPRHVRFHDLRHTCASLLLAQNVHPRVVMDVLGHSQISLTMDTYSYVMPALTRDAANLMDGVLTRSMAAN